MRRIEITRPTTETGRGYRDPSDPRPRLKVRSVDGLDGDALFGASAASVAATAGLCYAFGPFALAVVLPLAGASGWLAKRARAKRGGWEVVMTTRELKVTARLGTSYVTETKSFSIPLDAIVRFRWDDDQVYAITKTPMAGEVERVVFGGPWRPEDGGKIVDALTTALRDLTPD